MKITRLPFAELFAVHIPEGLTSAWVRGVQYIVNGTAEIEELERLYDGVRSL